MTTPAANSAPATSGQSPNLPPRLMGYKEFSTELGLISAEASMQLTKKLGMGPSHIVGGSGPHARHLFAPNQVAEIKLFYAQNKAARRAKAAERMKAREDKERTVRADRLGTSVFSSQDPITLFPTPSASESNSNHVEWCKRVVAFSELPEDIQKLLLELGCNKR